MKRQSEIIDDLSPVKRALLAVEEMSARLELAQRAQNEPIAICGIGCRFPGGANDAESFWQLLRDGKDAVTEVPPTRWDANTNGGNIRFGAFIDNVDQFDAAFFGISPREATHMDPQQRLVLEVAWEALEDAGQPVERLAGTSTGVFLGIYNNDYAWLQSDAPEDLDVYAATGGGQGIAANRLSYLLDLRGPSIAIDTTCSSSLVAVHLACQSLRNKECGLALAGGVNLLLSPQIALSVSKVVPMAADGRCKTFDARADGIVRGEGCGIVVLKRLTDALNDGDNIIAIIKGSAMNQDGHSNGFTAPNGAAQQAVIRHALQNAGVTPADVSYVEAHGTGTQLGDPIEWESLEAVFRRERSNPCLVGSVKTNFGHLEAAAGIAGLIKVALSLQHRAIPPHLHFTKMNPMTSSNGALEIPLALRDWTNAGGLVGGVSSFSLGGTNAHVVLGEAPALDSREHEAPELCLVTLSTRSDEALRTYAKQLRDQLLTTGDSERGVYDLAYTASLRRSHLSHRLALVSRTQRELITLLGSFIDGETHPGVKTGRASGKADGLVFVFSGQGTQWAGMGQKLFEHGPMFRRAVEECYELFAKLGVSSSLDNVADGAPPQVVQPAIFAIQVGLVALFREWRIVPDAVVGHSFGEITAAYAAGIVSLEEAVRIVCGRSKLFEKLAGLGGMAAVELPVREVEQLLSEFPHVSIAASNSPTSTVLSGETSALQAALDALKSKQVRCRSLRVNCAFHSQQVDAITDELEAALQDLRPNSSSIPFFSTVTGSFLNGEELNASYWARNARQTVWFAEAIETLSREHRVFLEIAPHAALTPDIETCLKSSNDSAKAIPTLRRDSDERSMLLRSLGALYTSGRTIHWEHVYRERGRQVRLPSYPWQRKRYWMQSNGAAPSATQLRPQARSLHPLLGSRLQTPVCTFESQLTTESLAHLNHHLIDGQVIFPAAGYMEMALAAAHEYFGQGSHVIRDLVFHGPLILSSAPRTVQLTLIPENSERVTVQIFSLDSDEWTLHAAGTVCKPQIKTDLVDHSIDQLVATFADELSIEEFGSRLANYGFASAGEIKGLQRLWPRNGEALAQLRLTPELVDQLHSYRVHPFLLDTALQTLLAALPEDGEDDGDDVFLSTGVERFVFHASPGVELWSRVTVRPYDASDRVHRTVDVRLYNSEGAIVAEVEGLALRRVALRALRTEASPLSEYFYEIQWQAKQLRAEESANLSLDVDELARELGPWSTRAIERFGLNDYRQVEPEVDALCALYVVEALRELGLDLREQQRVDPESLTEVSPRHRRLLNRMFEILREDGIINREGGIGKLPEIGSASSKWQTLIDKHPAYKAELTLLGRCGESLAKILTGHSDSLELLFPGGSFEEAEHLYEASPFAQTFNSMVEQAIRLALATLKDGEPIRVLEIGAGTGGTSAYVMPLLPSGQTRYVFTDVSNLFLYKARQKFSDYTFIDYKLLDVERDPKEQGFDLHQFDVVIASNVLHATSDLRTALNNVRQLMAPESLLLLLEATGKQRLVDFTFGLTDGWWEFKDNDLRPDYPLLPAKRWLNLLAECGFVEARAIPENTGGDDLQTSLILAQAPRVIEDTIDDCAGDWLIFNDGIALGNELAAVIKSRGGRLLDQVGESSGARVIYLASVQENTDVPAAALNACADLLHLVQSLASRQANASLWVVTRGAQPVAGDQSTLSTSPLWGLGPTIAMEHPEIWGGLIDIDATHDAAERIIAEVLANTGEDRVGFRGLERYVARLGSTSQKPNFGRVRFQSDASYLITGGFGGMGLRLAQWMADRGARNLVLAGRSGAATEEARLTVRKLEQSGVKVHIAHTDVSDANSVANLLNTIMPPLRGVFHAAGIFDDRVLLRHDRERFARVMAPKVNGAWNLHQLTKDTPLDFFVMFSSAAAFLGLMGLGNYTAANAFLDALAHYRQSLGLPALTIDWAGWTRIGMAEVLGERRESQWLAKGLDSLSPEQGLQAVNDLMLQSRPQVAVLKVDWPVFFKELPARRPPALLADVARSSGPSTTAKDSTSDFLSKLNAAEPGTPRRALLREHIRQQVAKILEFDSSFVLDPHQPLAEVGLDSLMAIELRNMLSTSIDRQLPPTLLFDYPTIDSVYSYLAPLVFDDEAKPVIEAPVEVDPELEGILEELESLPDNTVEMMLQGYARELLK
ncbi:MAG TPA: SDR family NAD(P)-dependent oxidoreductase [Pyrinomonadaceae bacterium]|nr:SDR family NAD(P)-dependent oxidoreductase [Pyrinomonadaceae bacterium]